jgi:hypothetical protein
MIAFLNSYAFLFTIFCSKANSKEVIHHLNVHRFSHEVASNKLVKGPLRDYDIVFCSPVTLTVLGRRFFKDLAFFRVFTSCSENIQNFGTS